MFYGNPLALGSIWLKNAVQLWEISLAAPYVVAGRSARFAGRIGAIPSARDTSELLRMGTEKTAAFSESLAAVGVHAWRTNLQLLELGARQWWGAWPAMRPAVYATAQAMPRLTHKAIAPVHRRVKANAKRLRRRARPRTR